MCASGDQNTIENQQMDQYKQLQEMTASQYANQQSVLGAMQPMFESIFQAGPNQEGFSAAEKQNFETQATEGVASNFSTAAKAIGDSLGSEGGGDAYMPSGATTQLREEVGTSAAAEQSKEEQQITQADYQQGLQDWEQAGQGLFNIAAQDNPLGYAGATTSSGSAASSTAAQIASENTSWINATIGAVGGVAGNWAGKV